MYKYHCLNPISHVGLDRFTGEYEATAEMVEFMKKFEKENL